MAESGRELVLDLKIKSTGQPPRQLDDLKKKAQESQIALDKVNERASAAVNRTNEAFAKMASGFTLLARSGGPTLKPLEEMAGQLLVIKASADIFVGLSRSVGDWTTKLWAAVAAQKALGQAGATIAGTANRAAASALVGVAEGVGISAATKIATAKAAPAAAGNTVQAVVINIGSAAAAQAFASGLGNRLGGVGGATLLGAGGAVGGAAATKLLAGAGGGAAAGGGLALPVTLTAVAGLIVGRIIAELLPDSTWKTIASVFVSKAKGLERAIAEQAGFSAREENIGLRISTLSPFAQQMAGTARGIQDIRQRAGLVGAGGPARATAIAQQGQFSSALFGGLGFSDASQQDAFGRSIAAMNEGAGGSVAEAGQSLGGATQAASRAQAEAVSAAKELAEWRADSTHSLAEGARLQQQAVEAQQRSVEAEKTRVEASAKYNDSLRTAAGLWQKFAADQRAQAAEQKRAEEDRLKGMRSAFGLQDLESQAGALHVARKLASGASLSQEELDFAKSQSILSDPLSKYGERLAARSGTADQILRLTGQDAKLREATSREAALSKIEVGLKQEIEAKLQLDEGRLAEELQTKLIPQLVELNQRTLAAATNALDNAIREQANAKRAQFESAQ